MRVVGLVSNVSPGTNLRTFIDNGIPVVAVVADKADAPAFVYAKSRGIPTELVPKKAQLFDVLKKVNPDYVCLAGWKQIIPDEVIRQFKVLNLHPGLIPDTMDGVVKCPDGTDGLWNKGMLTEKAIQNFLDKGATYAGSTVHVLTLEFDFGPVLGRVFEKIEPGDMIQTLYYERLKPKENQLYLEVLQKLNR